MTRQAGNGPAIGGLATGRPATGRPATGGLATGGPVPAARGSSRLAARLLAARLLTARLLATLCAAPLALAALLHAAPAAAEWTLEALFLQEFFYDDNVTFTDEDEESSFALRAQPALRLSKETPNSLFTFDAEYTHNRFFEEESLDSNDQRGEFDYQWQGNRLGLGLNGEVVNNTTRDSELTDSGRINQSVRRISWFGAPSFSYITGPSSRLEGVASINRVTYGNDGFEDFTAYNGRFSYIRTLTPRDDVGLVLDVGHFDSEDREDTEAENYVLSASWTRTPNSRLNATIEPGLRITNSRFDDTNRDNNNRDNETDIGFNVRGELDWRLNRGTLNASVLNAAEPSSTGALRQRTRAQGYIFYRLTPKLSASFSGAVEYSEEVDAARDENDKRTFFSAQPSLVYDITESWQLTGSYRFRAQDRDQDDFTASNAVFITISFNSIPFAF